VCDLAFQFCASYASLRGFSLLPLEFDCCKYRIPHPFKLHPFGVGEGHSYRRRHVDFLMPLEVFFLRIR